MQSDYTGQVMNYEWRWVIRVSGVAVLFMILPLLVLIVTLIRHNQDVGTAASQLQFMGAIHEPRSTALHLAHMLEGQDGRVLVRYAHTPEPHSGVFLDTIYVLLGAIAGVLSLQPLVVFHVARVGAVLFMCMALYGLGALIWARVRARRVFFVLSAFGGGLGWLFSPWLALSFPDLTGSAIYPVQAGLFNVHYPLVIGCLAFLVGGLVRASNMLHNYAPAVNNEGLTVFLFSLVLSVIYPQALFPILLAFLTLLIARGVVVQRFIIHDLRWMLWVAVPALPMALYYALVLNYNPVVAGIWLQQAQTAPDPLALLIGLGLPLILAIPGLWRAVRRFESDGNQVMLGWLVAFLVLMYLSPVIQNHFAVGLMIPVAYFATRGLEDYWFNLVARHWRYRLIAMLLPVVLASHVVVALSPILNAQLLFPGGGVMVERGYLEAFGWLDDNARRDEVVLASPSVGVWLPAWAGQRVVYASPELTLAPSQKAQAVAAWYAAPEDSGFNCRALLNGAFGSGRYRVSYVIFGAREAQFGTGDCIRVLGLIPVARFGDVFIYANRAG